MQGSQGNASMLLRWRRYEWTDGQVNGWMDKERSTGGKKRHTNLKKSGRVCCALFDTKGSQRHEPSPWR